MAEQELLLFGLVFAGGMVVGAAAVLLFNKARTGSASATKLKHEMEDYQGQVEAHFEQTSEKFKQMANQYQDLYQHMSVGAATLCRPENIAAGLTDQSDSPLQSEEKQQENDPQPDGNPIIDDENNDQAVSEDEAGENSAESTDQDDKQPSKEKRSQESN